MNGCITRDVLCTMISLHSGLIKIDRMRLLNADYKWVAIDATGAVFAYKSKPEIAAIIQEWLPGYPSELSYPQARLVGWLPVSSLLVRDWTKGIFELATEQSA